MAQRDVLTISFILSLLVATLAAGSTAARAQASGNAGAIVDPNVPAANAKLTNANQPPDSTLTISTPAGLLKRIKPDIGAMLRRQPQTPPSSTKRPITISDAVSIFLQQNLQLVAARYDIDTADAEKLTARLRPNPQITFGSSGLPLNFKGPFVSQQTFAYGISQTLELGGKRRKRIDSANANSDLAQGEFQTVVWQLTNDLKKKFYAVLLS